MLCTSNKVLRLLAVSLVALLLVGCSGQSKADLVKTRVREYNRQLSRAFAENNMNVLNTVATRDQAYTEYYQMAALGESRVRMLSQMRTIEFGDVTFSGDASATVETAETWDYEHVSMETSETVRTEKGVTYRLRYELVLQDGRWLVDKVTSPDDPPAETPEGD